MGGQRAMVVVRKGRCDITYCIVTLADYRQRCVGLYHARLTLCVCADLPEDRYLVVGGKDRVHGNQKN